MEPAERVDPVELEELEESAVREARGSTIRHIVKVSDTAMPQPRQSSIAAPARIQRHVTPSAARKASGADPTLADVAAPVVVMLVIVADPM